MGLKKGIFLFILLFFVFSCGDIAPPEIVLDYSQEQILPGESVSFDASESIPAQWSRLDTCLYEVLDGEEIIASSTSFFDVRKQTEAVVFGKFTHNFTQVGDYTVRVTLTDIRGNISTREQAISVSCFFKDINSLTLNKEYVFVNNPFSLDAVSLDRTNIATYQWRLKNGQEILASSSSQGFSVPALSVSGDVEIELTILDKFNNSKTLTSQLTIVSMVPHVSGEDFSQIDTPTWDIVLHPDTQSIRLQLNSQDEAGWTELSSATTEFTPSSSLAEGENTLYVQASDSDGVWSESGSHTILVDCTEPEIAFADGVTARDYFDFESEVSFSNNDVVISDNIDVLSKDDILITYQTLPDGQTELNSSYPGIYTIEYSISDRAGNQKTKTRELVIYPPAIDLSLADLEFLPFPQQSTGWSYTLSGAVGNTVNDFGGALTYKWTVTGDDSYTDLSPLTTTSKTISLDILNSLAAFSIEVYYADFPSQKSTFTESVKIFAPLALTNGDFEDAANIAPWKWDMDYQYSNVGYSPSSTCTTEPQDTSDNYSWYYNVCGIDATMGYNSSKGAKMYDTSFAPGDYFSANIYGTNGMLYSENISVYQGNNYEVTAKVYRGENGLTIPLSLQIYGVSGLTIEGGEIKQQDIPSLDEYGWQEVTITFTPDSDGQIRIRFFKGRDGNAWDTFYYGEFIFDDVEISYTE